ncbi:MAG: bifunctional riboflavin kinase/FAD synthetase [Chloroherpetonaceae bacterium]|nr:bifunctional riboflavin kinase/FAD synthetase [Chloroherpetonaceae bacterium]
MQVFRLSYNNDDSDVPFHFESFDLNNQKGLRHTLQKKSKCVLTLGSYDGVHLGHREIIEEVIREAREKSLKSVLITFDPHPRLVLAPESRPKILTTLSEKLAHFESLGLDEIVVIRFTREFSRMRADEFVRKVLIDELQIAGVVIGYDHGFGKDRMGTIETLKKLSLEHGFFVSMVEEQNLDGEHVSSSSIRKALESGDLRIANRMLKSPYCLSGLVIEGNKLGRRIGFPTANLSLLPEKLIPKTGVYFAETTVLGKKYAAAMNIGFRPSVTSVSELRVEAHMIGYEGDLYGKELSFNLLERIRDEQKFPTIDALKDQIQKDIKAILEYSDEYHIIQ